MDLPGMIGVRKNVEAPVLNDLPSEIKTRVRYLQ